MGLPDIQKLIQNSLRSLEEDDEVKLISFIAEFTSTQKLIAIENILIEAQTRGFDQDKVYAKITSMIDDGILIEKRKGYVISSL